MPTLIGDGAVTSDDYRRDEPTWFEHMTDYQEAVALGLHQSPVTIGESGITKIDDAG